MTATAETLVARRAGAMCIAAGRHGDSAEWPCDRHLTLARWLLGVPSAESNRPGTLNPRAAERATAIARTEGTR